MNTVHPFEIPVRRFPFDVTSTMPEQMSGTSECATVEESTVPDSNPTKESKPTKEDVNDRDKLAAAGPSKR